MSNLDTLMVLIPALPLAACLFTAVFGKHLLGPRAHLPTVLAIIASFLCSLPVLFEVRRQAAEHGSSLAAAHDGGSHEGGSRSVGWEHTVDLWRWLHVDSVMVTPSAAVESGHVPGQPTKLPSRLPFDVDVTLRVDPLTSIMLTMVTFISSLVAIYAVGYMHGDPGYWRFFTYISLFVFSMTMLVSSSNFVLLYCFWEAVGLCSYLLVGFWYDKPAAAAAGKKAFLVNRVGDFSFALGLFLIYVTYGTFNFHDTPGLAGVLGQTRLASPSLYVGGAVATGIGLLLLVGACGKSAQFPLHVWLPDAMEGPTPVSALIHAATMVTAGVYMVTRCTPLYSQSPFAQDVVATIGTVTALMAGIIALTQTDLKRVLAYSTISQLGYMFLALGVGTLPGICAGMFHLFTHAFFKALLFLGAGSVMHAMQAIDMRQFGGLRRLMPVTHWTFLFGCLALAGVFPWAGFWSKDAILAAAHSRAHESSLFEILYWAGMFTAFLTAVYTFRGYFLTFHGPERVPPEAGHHAHESPPTITVPLTILAVCALGVGAYFEYTHGFVDFLLRTPSLAFTGLPEAAGVHEFHMNVALISTAVALSGVGIAAFLFLGDQRQAAWLASALRPLYSLSYGKFYIDQIYSIALVWPMWLLAQLSFFVDRRVIDGLVNLVGRIPPAAGTVVRLLQTGMVQFYALAMVLGVLVLLAGIFWEIVGNSTVTSMPNLLLATIFLPLAGALWIWTVGGRNQSFCRQSALVSSLFTLVLAGILLANYSPGVEPYAVSAFPWLGHASPIDVQFSVGLDGLSLWLFGLTALLVLTSVMISWESITDRPGTYYGLMLLLETGMLGVFAARDIILFYIFFEFTLIPLFFLIGVWGSEDRRYAAMKFFLFTLAGSLLTFLGLLSIVLWDHSFTPTRMTFSIPELTRSLAVHPLDFNYQLWIFLALFAGFAIKVPLFPLHTWLPLAHTQAPAAGSVLLAGVLLKLGTYGFARFNLPMLPDATAACAPWILWLSVIGIIYGALVALTQTDLKRLIAYSSVSHLGFCMLGLFALDTLSVQGSVLQMINHGLSTGGLFALVGMIYDRYHTREIAKLGGLCRRLPILTFMFVLFTFSSIGLPGLNGFAGEFAILQGMFVRAFSAAPASLETHLKIISVVAVFGVVLGAWYMLWLVERVFFGPLREPSLEHDHGPAAAHAHAPAAADGPGHGSDANDHGAGAHGHAPTGSHLPSSSVRDLSLREVLALAPLIVFMFWIGLHPDFFTSRMSATLDPIALATSERFERFYRDAPPATASARIDKWFLTPFSHLPAKAVPPLGVIAPAAAPPAPAAVEEVARVD